MSSPASYDYLRRKNDNHPTEKLIQMSYTIYNHHQSRAEMRKGTGQEGEWTKMDLEAASCNTPYNLYVIIVRGNLHENSKWMHK